MIFVARSHARLVEANTKNQVATRLLLADQEARIQQLQGELVGAARHVNAHAVLRQVGLKPFMADADSAVLAEVEAVMRQLRMTKAQAIDYLRTRVGDPVTGTNGAVE